MWFPSWKYVFCIAPCFFTSTSFGVAVPTNALTTPPNCCTFDDDICSFSLSGGWTWSSSSPAPYVPYSDGNYIWTTTIDSIVFTGNQSGVTANTTFAVDYYLESPDVYMEVAFYSTDAELPPVFLKYLTNYNSLYTWIRQEIVCTHCCNGYPSCDGQLQIRLLGTSGYVGAIDNAARDDGCGSLSASIATVTPPTYCCDFENNTCSFTLSAGWYWSSTSPDPFVPYSDGNYIWTNSTNAVAYTAIQIGVTPTTVFSFDYYLNSSYAGQSQLEVSFIPTSVSTGEVILDYLYYYSNTWATGVIQCSTCCGGYPSCDGQLQVRLITSTYEDSGYAGAIDNAARDESCGGSVFSCCFFDDATMCGFNSTSMYGYEWSSSAVSSPDPYNIRIGIMIPGL